MERNPKYYIETFTGRKFWPFQPKAEEIDLIDMVHASSIEPRYGGMTKFAWPVGSHLLAGVDLLGVLGYGPYLQFLFVTHDLEESYLKDMPRPIKNSMPEYKAAGERLRDMIWFEYFGIRKPTAEEMEVLEAADMAVLYHEAIALNINKTEWVPEGALLHWKYDFKERLSSEIETELLEVIKGLLSELKTDIKRANKCTSCGFKFPLGPGDICWICYNS